VNLQHRRNSRAPDKRSPTPNHTRSCERLTEVARHDQVQLQLPGAPEYGRVARIAAAHLALRRGFSLNEIDDLRLVIDEAVVMLLGPGLPTGRLDITYSVEGDEVGVDARVLSDPDIPLPVDRMDRFAELVGELVDSYDIDPATYRIRLSKRKAAV